MGIAVASNFDMQTTLPLDSREVKADIAARNAIPAGIRYIGMAVKVLNDGTGNQKLYWLVGGILDANWQEFSSGGGGGGGFGMPVTKSADATILNTESFVLVNASSGNVTLTLPAAAEGEYHNFVRIDNTSNTVTIQRAGSNTIESQDGSATSWTLNFYMSTLNLVGLSTSAWGKYI